MAQLVSGECVGEMALLGQPERTASVWALEDAMLLKVSTRVLDAALEEIPELAGLFNPITWTRLLQEKLRTMGLFSNLPPSTWRSWDGKYSGGTSPAVSTCSARTTMPAMECTSLYREACTSYPRQKASRAPPADSIGAPLSVK